VGDAGHGGDLPPKSRAVGHEQGLNQVRRRELVLADQFAQRGSPAAATGSYTGRERHLRKTRERWLTPQRRMLDFAYHGTCFALFEPRTLFLAFTFRIRRLYYRKGLGPALGELAHPL
jgi:hypothetical protein